MQFFKRRQEKKTSNRPDHIFLFKPKQVVWQKQCYVRQGEFQTRYQTKLFCKKNQDIKSLINIILSFINIIFYLDKYQAQVSTCPLASNRTSVVFREHLVAFCLTFFAQCFVRTYKMFSEEKLSQAGPKTKYWL